jgi:hypothetical protein
VWFGPRAGRARQLLRAARDRTPDAEAAYLLESTDDAIALIASRVGYQTAAALSKLFHRHHGLSPGRNRAAQRLDERKGQAVFSETGSRRESAKKRKSGKRYPVYYNVLMTVKDVFERLAPETQDFILAHLRKLVSEQSRVMVVDLNLQYAIRVLSLKYHDESRLLLAALFRSDRNGAIKRDIILALARWRDWHWLSDLKNRFRQLTDVERRGFIVASFGLGDEGQHWRRHLRREFSPMEELMRDWSEEKHNIGNWQIPLWSQNWDLRRRTILIGEA